MTALPGPAHVSRLVSSVRRKLPGARRIGVRYDGSWNGPASLETGNGPARVAWCTSVLAAREALATATAEETLVLLTDRDPADLGTDVMARLAKGKLFSVIPWDILKDLFGAHELDRRLLHERWLAEALLEAAPLEGYPPCPTGFLDAGTAWESWLRHGLGFPDGAPDGRVLLEWASDPERAARFRAASPEARSAVASRLSETAGAIARSVLQTLEHATPPADALTIGLVCRVLFHADARSISGLRSAAVRLEPLLGGSSVSPAIGSLWADEAESCLLARWRALPETSRFGALRGTLERADALLVALKAQGASFLSDLLPSSFDLRLRRFGRALAAGLEEGRFDGPELERLRAAVSRHLLAARNPERVEAVEMACRLTRWLEIGRGENESSTFFSRCREFADSLGFVDSAREHLTVAESVPELAGAYRDLLSRVAEARDDRNRNFGQELSKWCAAPGTSESEIPVESVIPKVVAPLAAGRPVLLVVLDGMSYGVFRSIAGDLVAAGWKEIAPGRAGRRLSAISAVPSVTEVSRTSLLCGALVAGGSAEEKNGFSKHPALLAASRAGRPPALFHKSDLAGPGGVGISPTALEKVEKPENRVVGVVLNAVDDHLLKGDQLHVKWGLGSIQPLRVLLEAAGAAGRLVIVTADHGHIVERELSFRPATDAGERYRPPASPPLADEVTLEGPRVGPGFGAKVIAPWSERVRYGQKKNGYHGGATPQEMVVPLAIWTSTDEMPADWQALFPEQPGWWEFGGDASSPAEPAIPAKAKSSGAASAQLELPVAPNEDWIGSLLGSPAWVDQKGTHGRLQVPDDVVRQLLSTLEALGGQATKAALARKMDLPPFRLAGLLPAVRRLLNVDGYGVLSIDESSDTVTLNRDLLEAQFGLR